METKQISSQHSLGRFPSLTSITSLSYMQFIYDCHHLSVAIFMNYTLWSPSFHMSPRESRLFFINYSEYSCVWSFLLVCLNESWWQTSNGGLSDFSLQCLQSLLWMDIFPSTVPLPATCLIPGSSQLWLCLPLRYSSNYVVFLTQLWQLPGSHTANPWRPVFHSPHAVILLALQQFSYLYASHTHCSMTFLTSSMGKSI